jgi:adenylosuccinate synthase
MLNGATQVAVTKLDCVYPKCKGARTYNDLPSDAKQFINEVEKQARVPVALIGTGPEALDIIDRRR